MSRLLHLVIVPMLLLIAQNVSADGVLISWSPSYLKGASQESFDLAKALPVETILANNVAADSWPAAYHVVLGAMEHKNDKAFLRKLTDQLSDPSERKLADTTRLIIWERITLGDILFEGKGMQISDDLFSVAGRANWILRKTTGRKFGYVRPHAKAAELKILQDHWRAWLEGQLISDVLDAYPTKDKGLEEIRSMEALEALIASLAPSAAKARVTRDCLASLYHLDQLPADPASPARLCSPDTYTNGYLAVLTDVEEQHDAAWWAIWWPAQHSKLAWDEKAGKFRRAH